MPGLLAMTTTTTATENEFEHIVASESYRLQSFASEAHFPLVTRRQLALAGFVYRDDQCVCPQCGITIALEPLDDNLEYESNFFRKLHRKKVSLLGKRCSFLLCESGTNIDNLRTLSTGQQQQWDDAEEPEYSNYSARLQSFDFWPGLQRKKSSENTFVTSKAMAEHGFYFSGPKDGVTCFYCGNTLIDWSVAIQSPNEKIVQLEHARFFPCRFVNCTAGSKFVANAGYFHTVSAQERRDRNVMRPEFDSTANGATNEPRTIDQCLASFDTWPGDASISGQALANAGFYYLGSDLAVKCFMCGLIADDWRYGMTALGTHRKRMPNCEFVRAIDSTKTGDVQTVNEKWRLETLTGLSFVETNDNSQSDTDQRLCRELAACGFYRHKNTKIIRCAYCGVTVEPKHDQSIMTQHRHLTKQTVRKLNYNDQQESTIDCIMVRAQCPANIVIPDRERFPEYIQYQSIFARLQSLEIYQERHKLSDDSTRDIAEAGFFLCEQRRIRCFQCGNSLPIHDKSRKDKFPNYNMTQLHAHFYPTCEWVKELLGPKYIAQVLHDRFKSIELASQPSFNAQSSSSSSSHNTIGSFSSTTTTPALINESTTLTFMNSQHKPYLSDASDDTSDDEDFEPVAPPPTASCIIRSPPPSSVQEVSMTVKAQTCSDPIPSSSQNRITSPMMSAQINPFIQLVLQQQRDPVEQSTSTASDLSPPAAPSPNISSPVDITELLSHESNRLDTFKKQGYQTFADVDVKYLAYVGFFLNGEGTAIQCPWCKVKMSDGEFDHIMRSRPSVAGSVLSEEAWTPMRVHRHCVGQLIDKDHSWCTWVRREAFGLHPNVAMIESQMLYPEFPSYGNIEKRMKSFTDEWNYPGGSRLSKQLMAEAGFFYMGKGSVCCYYCGNKLQNFEPCDCPFEEHATFYPLCDFIQKVRGIAYVNRILLENGQSRYARDLNFSKKSRASVKLRLVPQGRLKYEIDGIQRIKRIIFDKSGPTKRKSERPPVPRIFSGRSNSSRASIFSSLASVNGGVSQFSSITTTMNDEKPVDDTCVICTVNPATHEYDPCQHCQICGECFAKLGPEHLQNCMHCHRSATIRMRTPNTPLT